MLDGSTAGLVNNEGTLDALNGSSLGELYNFTDGISTLDSSSAGLVSNGGMLTAQNGSSLEALDNLAGATTILERSAAGQVNNLGILVAWNNSSLGELDNFGSGTAIIDGSTADLVSNAGMLTAQNGSSLNELDNLSRGTVILAGSTVGLVSNAGMLTAQNGSSLYVLNNLSGASTILERSAAGQVNNLGILVAWNNSSLGELNNFGSGTAIVDGSTADLVSNAGMLTAQNGSSLYVLNNLSDASAVLDDSTGGLVSNGGILTVQNGSSLYGLDNLSGASTILERSAAGQVNNLGILVAWNNSSLNELDNLRSGTATLDGSTAGLVGNAGMLTAQNGSSLSVLDNLASATATLDGSGAEQVKNSGKLIAENGSMLGRLDNQYGAVVTLLKSTAGDITNSGNVTLADSQAGNVINKAGASFSTSGGKLKSAENNGSMLLGQGTTVAGDVISEKGKLTMDGSSVIGQLSLRDGSLYVSTKNASVGSLSTDDSSNVMLDGTLTFLRGDMTPFNSTLSGNGGVNVNGGMLNLTRASLYRGDTVISGGTLRTGVNNAIGNTRNVMIAPAGTLNLAGLNQTISRTENHGTLIINDPGVRSAPLDVTVKGNIDNYGNIVVNNCASCAGNTLNFDGNYTGHDGTLYLGSVLGGDNSLTDRLVINGRASGHDYVTISNENGQGGRTVEGIRVISTRDSAPGVFEQKGRVVAGPYDYFLRQGNADGQNVNNWYLTSYYSSAGVGRRDLSRIARPENGAYSANLFAANTMFDTSLSDRGGDKAYRDAITGEESYTTMWMRNTGGHSVFRMNDDQNTTTANRYVLQLGGEVLQWTGNGSDGYHLGLTGGYASQHSNTRNSLTGYRAKGDIHGYTSGLYGTWYQNEQERTGLYVDSQVRYSWFDNEVSGSGLTAESYKSSGLAASLESGYTLPLGSTTTTYGMLNRFYLRPEAQVTWTGVKADDHTEMNGTRVSDSGDENVQTRLGMRFYMNGKSHLDKGTPREFQPFIETNWIYNTKQYGTVMNKNADNFHGTRNTGQVRAGVEGKLSDNLNASLDVSQNTGGESYHDTQGSLSVKYLF